MPTRVSYNDARLIPAPLVTIRRSFQTTGDGTKIGAIYTITLNGTLVADMGSPNSQGEFWKLGGYPPDEVIQAESRLASILTKQDAIRKLFSKDGLSLEIQSADGSPPFKCNPRVQNNDDSEGIWFNLENFSITLEADKIYLGNEEINDGFTDYISSADETWSIEQDDFGTYDLPPTYKISHTVTATGKRFFDDNQLSKEAWEQAKSWVLPRLGLSPIIYSGVNNIPDYYGGYNHLRSEQIGELNGTYSITETWVLSSGTFVEDFDISSTATIQDPLKRVVVNGSIKGLDQKNNGMIIVSKIDNAETRWSGIIDNIYIRAKQYSGYNLNPLPISITIGKNPTQGTISYTYEYNTRPLNVFTNATSEVITLNDSNNVDLFAIIPIPFKADGPIIQSIETKREKTRQLNIEIFFDYNVGSGTIERFITNHPENRSPQKDELINFIQALTPHNSKISENNYNWDGINHYSKTIGWVY